MNRTTQVILGVAAVGATAGAGWWGYKSVKEYLARQQDYLADTKVELDAFNILDTDVRVSTITARITLRITNKSDFQAIITRQRFKVSLNGSLIKSVDNTTPIVLPDNASTLVNITVTINTGQTLRNIWDALAGALPGLDNMILSINGILSFKSGIIFVNKFEFTISKSLEELFSNIRV